MYSSRFIIFASFWFTFCNCQKLICRGKVFNDQKYNFEHAFISYRNSDSNNFNFSDLQEFDLSRKTVIIIPGMSFNHWGHQWAFEMGKKWLERVELCNDKINNIYQTQIFRKFLTLMCKFAGTSEYRSS